jgi:hypothetical protein
LLGRILQLIPPLGGREKSGQRLLLNHGIPGAAQEQNRFVDHRLAPFHIPPHAIFRPEENQHDDWNGYPGPLEFLPAAEDEIVRRPDNENVNQ